MLTAVSNAAARAVQPGRVSPSHDRDHFPVAELPFAVAEAEAVDGRPDHRRDLAVETGRGRGVNDLYRVV
jgi:hypothetical protein